jgi:hypothetical protein
MSRNFPGSGAAVVGDAPGADVSGAALTVAFWVYADNNPGFNFPLAKGSGDPNIQYQFLRVGSNYRFEPGQAGGTHLVIGDVGNIQPGIWAHVCGRCGGGGASLAVNGATLASAGAGNIPDTAQSLNIGHSFYGKVAEVGIWNVILANEEVVALAKGFSPLMIRPASLRGYWPMDGLGTVERNLKGTGDGTTPGANVFTSPPIIVPRPAIYLP